jgi:CheY-like chemotaxis protein
MANRISLVVDDEASVRKFISATLRLADFLTFEAEDGAQALRIVRDLGDDIALIVSDIQMPNGDGLTFARAVKEVYPAVPIILVSGCNEPDGDFALFLRKPFPASALLEAVRSLVSDELMAVPAGDRP